MALQVKNSLIIIMICILVSLVFGCRPHSEEQAETELSADVILVSPAVVAEETLVSTSRPLPVPTVEPDTPSGNLFIISSDQGFLRVILETGETEPLVSKDDAWLLWRFAISPNQEKVAYWIQTSQTSELWLSDLISWSPELLLSTSELEHHDAVNLWWLSNDYLLLEPGTIDQRFNLFVPADASIINVHQKQVEIEDTGFAFNCLLARSPRTDELATWCPAKENWSDVQSYYTAPVSYYAVIEEAGFLWTTIEPPVEILTQLKTPDDNWAWSRDRSFVSFPLYDAEQNMDVLHFVERSTLASFQIEQQSVRHISDLDWSPDGQYLAYLGTCATYACNLIIDLASREIIWSSQMIQGLQNGTYLAWSHDSQFVALQFEGITIVDLRTNKIIQQLKIPSANVLAWLP